MSETIKLEIEIPAPPEGWGEVEYRAITIPEQDSKFWNGNSWVACRGTPTTYKYPIARKLTPLWTPPPEWHAMFGDGWLTRDYYDVYEFHNCAKRPDASELYWHGNGSESALVGVKQSMLPPSDIPWEQCCFKIGDSRE